MSRDQADFDQERAETVDAVLGFAARFLSLADGDPADATMLMAERLEDWPVGALAATLAVLAVDEAYQRKTPHP